MSATSTIETNGRAGAATQCFHCGTPCREDAWRSGAKAFCCNGCLTVFELLTENGLDSFYTLSESAGVRVKASRAAQFNYVDEKVVRERLVDFEDACTTRVTFRIPAIHCIACVWLLENLFRLKPGVGASQVNFPRKELSLSFENAKIKLSEVVALLASLGYEPELKLSDLEGTRASRIPRRLWMQIGVAGFAFGNLMLFSIAVYFGLDAFSGPAIKRLVGWMSLVMAVPVVVYSAADYWRSAWNSLRQKRLAIEVPIAAGIIAIFAQSVFDVATGRGEGYFDSLCGLIFFLLCGRLFQQKTFDRLSFERDYKSFFPLSVTRLESGAAAERQVSLSQLAVGDHLLVRNGELIPADARLVTGPACIDYSFVTGESEPIEKRPGEHLYAGGRQIGGAIEIETVKAVSQSYLTSLWNQEAFRKGKADTLDTLTNVYSYRFTKIVIGIALGAAAFWAFRDSSIALKAFTSVLIVACPCALALAAPFTLGTAIRVLGRRGVFVKSPQVVETLARVDTIVFDKTGTLTAAGANAVEFDGAPLNEDERRWVASVTRQSTHPLAARIAASLSASDFTEPVLSFVETAGCGIEGTVSGREIWMGSAAWLELRSVRETKRPAGRASAQGSTVHLVIDGKHRGCFVLENALRPDTDRLIERLGSHYELTLLSGDNDRQRDTFVPLFGHATRVQFDQSPLNKFEFVRGLQSSGKTVMMVGDGLNDAGALKQSEVGVAVVESIAAFSPASDIIMSSAMVPRLDDVLSFSKRAVRIVRLSFLLSSLYNVVGISIAASGLLAPVVCAILMPVSSITVVAFACGATTWAGRMLRVEKLRVENRRLRNSQRTTLNSAPSPKEAA
jgi:P-type Cu+ transporter